MKNDTNRFNCFWCLLCVILGDVLGCETLSNQQARSAQEKEMTNKTECYFVVSESELEILRQTSWDHGFSVGADTMDLYEAQKKKVEAEAACRARPLSREYIPEELFKALIGVKGYSLKRWMGAK